MVDVFFTGYGQDSTAYIFVSLNDNSILESWDVEFF